jgi:serine protease AprX
VLDFTGANGPSGRDDNGHGSMVAGIAAGSSSAYPGVSPTSNIYSLKVVRGDGCFYVGDVIAAADWIYTHQFSNNIRVANFSLRSSFPDYAAYDPFDAAVRCLRLGGVVVVASAGNNGNGRMLYAPANDPFVITVGASDINDTVTRSDDSNAPWTSYGYTAEGFAKPELGAPGRWMIGPTPASSTLATTFPDRMVAPGLHLDVRQVRLGPRRLGPGRADPHAPPSFTLDQVKGALMLTAKRAPLAAPMSLGVGEVDASAASVPDPPNPNANLYGFVRSDADGNPSFDWDAWNAFVATNASWTNVSWTDASWTNASWTDNTGSP